LFSLRPEAAAPWLGRKVLGGLLAAQTLLALLAWVPLSSDCALILHEYSRFAYVIKNGALSTWTTPKDQLGYTSVAGRAPFEYHADYRTTSGDSPAEAAVPAERPPIVVVLWDAARPDHMGCYGYDRPTTPHADRLAAESIVFDSAYSMATATTCGVRHILTGQYSSRFMLETDHDPFVVHRLRELGYRDFFITAFGSDYNGVSLDSFLRKGPKPDSDGSRFLNVSAHPLGLNREVGDGLKVEGVIAAWEDRMESHGSLDGTFTWLHFTGCHFPWSKPDSVPDFGDEAVDLYDAEMAQVDALTGRALDALRSMGEYDDALILLLADHGTGLGEHGRLGGFLPYEEQIRIPMLLHLPGGAAQRVSRPVASIDVAPTLVEWLQPQGSPTFHGVSLLATEVERNSIVSLCAFEDAYALIEEGRWKLHYHRDQGYAALFDLEMDPGERDNLVEEMPERYERMLSSLGAFLWQGRGSYGNPHFYRASCDPIESDR
jgi:choline-sulfatase